MKPRNPIRCAPVAASGRSREAMRLNPHLFPAHPLPSEPQAAATGKPRRAEGCRLPNKTEARFLAILEARKRGGEVTSYRYEGMTLKWGVDEKTGAAMRYTPDAVVFVGDRIVLIEVKGAHIRDRDLVRFKGCRAQWPEFTFEMWQEVRREWSNIL